MAHKSAAKKAKKLNKLDYSLIPEPEFTPTFMVLPQELEKALQKLPRTLERMDATLWACHELGGGRSKSESAFRTALSEYASIEDILNRELSPGQPVFRLSDTENPLPHIMKQLRNLQVHLIASKMSDHTISLWLKNVPGAEPVDITCWIIGDITDAQLLDLDAFQKGYYTKSQATEMVNWINERQTLFGIGDIIYRGVVEAAERIVSVYLK
jgi:hypothetical protein